MALSRHALAVWRRQHVWIGVALDDPDLCVAAREAEVVPRLKDKLRQRFLESPWLEPRPEPRAELHWLSLTVRPEQRIQNRRYAAFDELTLSLPVALSYDEDGVQQCSLPTLGTNFYLPQGGDGGPGAWRRAVEHVAREQLAGLAPEQFLPLLDVHDLRLEEVRLKIPRPKPPTARPELPTLSQVATLMQGRGQRAYCREACLDELQRRLQEGASVVIVAPSGAGKTALAQEVSRSLAGRLWRSSGSRLIAGMQYLGQWEARLEQALEELKEVSGILCLESAAPMVQLGGQDPAGSLGAFLVSSLEQGDAQLLLEASPEEWLAVQRLLPAFADLFQVLHLPALDESTTLDILARVRSNFESQRSPTASPQLDLALLRLVRRFQPYLALPGGAIGWMRMLFERYPASQGLSELYALFSEESGIPEIYLRDDCPLAPSSIRAELQKSLVGQAEAVEVATSVLATLKSGLHDPHRPLGVLLLCGPTGVGKTELARALARTLFGSDRERLIRLDMSEFASEGAAERMLGTRLDSSPPPLIRAIRRQPFSVVLLDEVEKAHPEVFDVLLRVLDEGFLCDALGRLTHFQSALILMTSNLGAEHRPVGLQLRLEGSTSRALQSFFRPEFLNRLDHVVHFQPLDARRVAEIARKELKELEQRPGLKSRRLRLSPQEALLQLLVDEGFDARFGARPLQRAVERRVITALSQLLNAQPQLREVELELDWDGRQVLVYPV